MPRQYEPVSFGDMISRGQKAYPVSLKKSRLVEMIAFLFVQCALSKEKLPRLTFSLCLLFLVW